VGHRPKLGEGGKAALGSRIGCYNRSRPRGLNFPFLPAHRVKRGTPDGWFPESLLARDSLGNVYGVAGEGGTDSSGTVFKVDKHGEETVLHNFTGGSDGCLPVAGLIADSAGNLYGVTAQGGSGFCDQGYGVVFKLDTAGNLRVLHTFGFSDGAYPASVLLLDQAGNLYGTTEGGGNSTCGFDGCGVFFELSPQQDGTWTETMLYAFCSVSGCADGAGPFSGPVVRDSAGNIYGTTTFGGSAQNCNGGTCGVVFKVDTSGKETGVHNFTGGADGAGPQAGLVTDASGELYGVALQGGDNKCNPPSGCGTVFRIIPRRDFSTCDGSRYPLCEGGAYSVYIIVRDPIIREYESAPKSDTGSPSLDREVVRSLRPRPNKGGWPGLSKENEKAVLGRPRFRSALVREWIRSQIPKPPAAAPGCTSNSCCGEPTPATASNADTGQGRACTRAPLARTP